MSLSALSTEYIRVPVRTTDGADVTSAAVEMAIVSGRYTPPGDSDWHSASWDTTGAVAAASLLVGPDGVIELDAGAYSVWVRLTDNPEVPVLRSGLLTVS